MDAKRLYFPQEIVHETIIDIFKIFSHCQIASVATARFNPPKTEEEEISVLSEAVPKNTKYNTKWAVNVFTARKNTRINKKAQLKTSAGNGLESTNVKDLSVPLEHMSADSLNFWLCKFICEVAKQTGERYPPKTLDLLVCGINRHLGNVQGQKAFNILEKILIS